MPTDVARYSIGLFKQGGDGIEQMLDRHADITVAWSIYESSIKRYPQDHTIPPSIRKTAKCLAKKYSGSMSADYRPVVFEDSSA